MNTRKFSSKQEKYVAKKLNGRVQPNSGATPFLKGDIVLTDFLIECKTQTTSKQSITIKKDWLVKLNEEKLAMRKPYCSLVFNFGPDEQNYYIIDERTFKQLKEESENEL